MSERPPPSSSGLPDFCCIDKLTGSAARSPSAIRFPDADAETASSLASMFFIGITVGRALSGFITMKLNDTQMIRPGQFLIAIGIAVLLIPRTEITSLIGLTLAGFGCAPIYPCIIHSTPGHFGAENSLAIIGVQIASAYAGSCLMPLLSGLIANHISAALFPFYLLVILVLMIIMHELLTRKTPIR